MAIQTYRYRYVGPAVDNLNMLVPPAFPVVNVGTSGNTPERDLQIDDSAKDDLDAAMESNGWEYVSINPNVSPPQGIIVRKVIEVPLAVDASTVSNVFVDLITTGVFGTGVGFLEVHADLASNALVALGAVRLMLDGVPIAESGAGHLVGLAAHAVTRRIAIAAGNHEIKLQWRADAGGTLEVRPVTQSDTEHATLLVRETT